MDEADDRRRAAPEAARRNPQRAVAVFWALLGAVVTVAAWRMDRLQNLGINPWSAPGLLPGVIGALMVVLAAVLWHQGRRESSESPGSSEGAEGAGAADAARASSPLRSVAAAALCVAFAAGAVGRGAPFALASGVFVFVFSCAFGWRTWRRERRLGRGVAVAAAVAMVAAPAIAWLFESVFLVRLP